MVRGHSHDVRIDHAEARFLHLQRMVAEWLNGEHHQVIREYHADRTPPVFEISVRCDELLPELGLLVSEIVQNLRMSLDNLVYSLAVKHSGEPLPVNIAGYSEFPIIGNVSRAGNPQDGMKVFAGDLVQKRKLGGIDPNLIGIIEFLQPCAGHLGAYWWSNPLWWLHELGCADKHRLLLPVVAHSNDGKFDPSTAYHSCTRLPGVVEFIEGPMESETETVVARFPVKPWYEGLTEPPYMNVNYEPSLRIDFGERAPDVTDKDVVDTIARIIRCIREDVLPPLYSAL